MIRRKDLLTQAKIRAANTHPKIRNLYTGVVSMSHYSADQSARLWAPNGWPANHRRSDQSDRCQRNDVTAAATEADSTRHADQRATRTTRSEQSSSAYNAEI